MKVVLDDRAENLEPISIGFLLLKNFTMISLASAVEPLRMANQLSEKKLFEWHLLSEIGKTETASDGISVSVDASIFQTERVDVLIVAGGLEVHLGCTVAIKNWLRGLDQKGVQLGGICTGAYVLAAAGLLDNHACSIHWESKAVINELFPLVKPNNKLFTVDRGRLTSAGGIAPLDMMIKIIRSNFGSDLARAISEMFLLDRIRDEFDIQKTPLQNNLRIASKKLAEAISLMETNIEEPISLAELSSYVGTSRRQLERLFKANLDCSPSRFYLRIRLSRSRELLRQTNFSTVEVATLSGFKSTPHFSKCYREYFGSSPRDERTRSDGSKINLITRTNIKRPLPLSETLKSISKSMSLKSNQHSQTVS